MGDGGGRGGEGPRGGDVLLLLLLLLLLLPLLLLLLGCQRERLILLFDIVVILGVRVTLVLRWRHSATETQVLSPLCQAVVHSDLLPLGDVSDGDYDQPHLTPTVDLSDAAVRGGGK